MGQARTIKNVVFLDVDGVLNIGVEDTRGDAPPGMFMRGHTARPHPQ